MHRVDVSLSVIILAAGRGTRMMSTLPKVMHPLCARPMIGYVIGAVSSLNPRDITVVVGDDGDSIRGYCSNEINGLGMIAHFAIQNPPNGTAKGVWAGMGAIKGANPWDGVLIVFGDTPLIDPETLTTLRDGFLEKKQDLCVVAMDLADPKRYGRLVFGQDGGLESIVEYKDATPAQRSITLCNAGVMMVRRRVLEQLVGTIQPSPETGEYYLTHLPALAKASGFRVSHHVAENAAQFEGINTREDLAEAESYLQWRFRQRAMAAGVTLIDPKTVTFSHDTRLGADCTVEPHVVFGEGVEIEKGARIKSFSHIEGAYVESGAVIGPFARLRPGTHVGAASKVGNFVEIKSSTLEGGVKVSHLSYVGDATIGAGTNIGAGVITCNYDGFKKWPTRIGADVFVGSNTALIAPVTLGDRSIIGAGSVIGGNVEADDLALTRGPLRRVDKGAQKYRARLGQKTT